jgi:hypothetical protein
MIMPQADKNLLLLRFGMLWPGSRAKSLAAPLIAGIGASRQIIQCIKKIGGWKNGDNKG